LGGDEVDQGRAGVRRHHEAPEARAVFDCFNPKAMVAQPTFRFVGPGSKPGLSGPEQVQIPCLAMAQMEPGERPAPGRAPAWLQVREEDQDPLLQR